MKIFPRVVEVSDLAQTTSFKIKNSAKDDKDRIVLFKIRRSEPKLVSFSPKSGVVEPGMTHSIKVQLTDGNVTQGRILVKLVAIKRNKLKKDFEASWAAGCERGPLVKKIVDVRNATFKNLSRGQSIQSVSEFADDAELSVHGSSFDVSPRSSRTGSIDRSIDTFGSRFFNTLEQSFDSKTGMSTLTASPTSLPDRVGVLPTIEENVSSSNVLMGLELGLSIASKAIMESGSLPTTEISKSVGQLLISELTENDDTSPNQKNIKAAIAQLANDEAKLQSVLSQSHATLEEKEKSFSQMTTPGRTPRRFNDNPDPSSSAPQIRSDSKPSSPSRNAFSHKSEDALREEVLQKMIHRDEKFKSLDRKMSGLTDSIVSNAADEVMYTTLSSKLDASTLNASDITGMAMHPSPGSKRPVGIGFNSPTRTKSMSVSSTGAPGAPGSMTKQEMLERGTLLRCSKVTCFQSGKDAQTSARASTSASMNATADLGGSPGQDKQSFSIEVFGDDVADESIRKALEMSKYLSFVHERLYMSLIDF
jgi:hypothetical protein